MRNSAYSLIREQPHYRRDAFDAGLAACGYEVRHAEPGAIGAGDVLVIWNRYGHAHDCALRFERAGAAVLVCENGYIGQDAEGRQFYAIARNFHNGAGTWPQGDGSRLAKLGIELKPWRTEGQHIVVFGQRGIGIAPMASPPGWHDAVPARLKKHTQRTVKIRPHPGNPANHPLVAEGARALLDGAHACVIWCSANGVRALVEGVPVFYEAPNWSCEGAALKGIELIESPKLDDAARLAALERMACGQWSVAEIESGEPFARLLQ